MRIKDWNTLVDETMDFMNYYRDHICGMNRGCDNGQCYCDREDLLEVFELQKDDIIRLLEMITGSLETARELVLIRQPQ